jgi:hypothetical protein
MTLKDHWLIVGVMVALTFAIPLGVTRPALASPALRRSVEYSNATSTKECGQQVVSVLGRLKTEGQFRTHNGEYAATKDSTVSINCIFVGRSDQRAKQWIFNIVVASNDAQEGREIMELLRTRLRGIVRID